MSRSLMVGLLAAGCMTAAAGGSYLAVRQTTAEPVVASTAPAPAAAQPAEPAATAAAPVHETEAVIEAPAAPPVAAPPEAAPEVKSRQPQ